MKSNECYESYPVWVIIIANLVSVCVYTIGALIIYQIGTIWFVLYLLYILLLEVKLLRTGCINCYYYGKYCAFGKGKLSRLLFKKGNPDIFSQKQIAWKDTVPDILVSVIPVTIGVVLLILNFNWLLLLGVIILLLLTSIGNGVTRGSLACKHCKQLELGCPAQQLFNKNKR
ncbi:hypothetical protein ACFLV8_00710 [Chloroflexota bacterium]